MNDPSYRFNKSMQTGKEAEKRFRQKAELLGWNVETANSHQDKHEHWDFKLVKNTVTYLVDVKAMKKLSRQDTSTQANFHYVELKNVNGEMGWLYGLADYFAFE